MDQLSILVDFISRSYLTLIQNFHRYNYYIYLVSGFFLTSFLIPDSVIPFLNVIGDVSVLTVLLFLLTNNTKLNRTNYSQKSIQSYKEDLNVLNSYMERMDIKLHPIFDGVILQVVYQMLGGSYFVWTLGVAIVTLCLLDMALQNNHLKTSEDTLIDKIIKESEKDSNDEVIKKEN